MTTSLLPVSSRNEQLSDEQLRKLRIMAAGTKKSFIKDWDEAKQPRGVGGGFGSGGGGGGGGGSGERFTQNSAKVIQSSIERLGSKPTTDGSSIGVRDYNTRARDASATAVIEHLPENAKDQVSQKVAGDVIDSWGVSANDTPQGLVIQDAAQKVFGLTDVAQADRTGMEKDIAYITKNFGGQVEAVLQGAYSATQEKLAAVGLQPNDKITVYRGVDIPEVNKVKVGERLDFTQRALSSFTLDPSIAHNFGKSILQAEVPVKDIVSLPGTGLGFASLAEVVVKSSSDTVLTKVNVGEAGIVTKAKSESVNIDRDEASAHWLHRILVKTQKSLTEMMYEAGQKLILEEIAFVQSEIERLEKNWEIFDEERARERAERREAKDETSREPKGNRPDPVNEFLSTVENSSDVHEMGVYHWADARLEQDAALDFEQQRALENYTREEYEPINEGLRGNAAMSQLDALQTEALDSAFTKGNEMSDDTTLYRGIRADASELKEGQVIQDHAFLSTSAAPEIAHGFATTDPKGIKSDAPGYVVQITAPKGTPYLVGNAEETEVVMQRNTMLVVDGVESGGKAGVSTVYAHVVGVGE